MRKLSLPLFLVISTVLLLWLIGKANRDDGGADNGPALPTGQDYDYYLSSVQSTRFGPTGQTVYHLVATRVTHYPDTDLAIMEAPRLTYFEASRAPWTVTAVEGRLSPDAGRNEERLDLVGDVVLRQAGASGTVVEMQTAALTIFPVSEEALTDAAVTLLATGTRLESIGLHAELASEKIELLNAVKGYHTQHAPLP
jgi:lipopolysaccharide export system protein LptC